MIITSATLTNLCACSVCPGFSIRHDFSIFHLTFCHRDELMSHCPSLFDEADQEPLAHETPYYLAPIGHPRADQTHQIQNLMALQVWKLCRLDLADRYNHH